MEDKKEVVLSGLKGVSQEPSNKVGSLATRPMSMSFVKLRFFFLAT